MIFCQLNKFIQSLTGKSIWDGNKIGRHAGDQDDAEADVETIAFDDDVGGVDLSEL